MVLITGPAWQGKEKYAREHYPGAEIVRDFHLEVLYKLRAGLDPVAEAEKMAGRSRLVILCDEIGCGVVPTDPEERKWRELCGRAQCLLAERADEVIRVICGIGMPLKERKRKRVVLIRHGTVRENLERRFIGSTDSSLIEGEAERIAALYEPLRRAGLLFREGTEPSLFVSPLRRARESAEALFPGLKQKVVQDLGEIDFGDFENKNHDELTGDPAYEAYLASCGELPFPGGESREEYTERTCRAFCEALKSAPGDAAVVAHGGTMMAVLSRFGDGSRDYFGWQCPNGCGYAGYWDPVEERILELSQLPPV